MPDKTVRKIMNFERYPKIKNPENLEFLNDIADEMFKRNKISDKIASIIIYHQIIECICIHLLEYSRFQMELSVYPEEIEFSKIKDNYMLGNLIKELKIGIKFYMKDELISRVEDFNRIRNHTVHNLTKSDIYEITANLKDIKSEFDYIFYLYEEIKDNFHLIFKDFRKDSFIEIIDENQINH